MKGTHQRRSLFRDERGSVLLMVAGGLVAIIGMAALAIDLGILFTARSEAQRAAEAGAHAGASVFLSAPNDEATAREQARIYAERNTVRWGAVEILDEDIDVELDQQLVRVRVRRTQERGNPVANLFARIFGINTSDIGAVAAAQSWPADGVECLLPFAAPDRWSVDGQNTGSLTNYPGPTDVYDADNDLYRAWNPAAPTDPYTGYSMNDRGYPIRMYSGDPDDAPQPSWWYAFCLPGGNCGANTMRDAIQGCLSDDRYTFGEEMDVETEPGAMAGPVRHGFEHLIDQDPDARWSDSLNNGEGCVTRDGQSCVSSSPRIRPMVLFDPSQPPELGRSTFTIMNFVGVFIERTQGGGAAFQVDVRFMQYTALEPPDEWYDSDTTLRMIRIVE